MTEDVTTIDIASARHKVHPATLRRWIRDGDLPASRAGHRYQVADRDVRRAIEMPRRRGRPRGIQLSNRSRWFSRIVAPRNGLMGLGDASETWRPDLAKNWEHYWRLLPDAAEAAAAVEYTSEKIHRAIAAAEAFYVPHLPLLLEGPEPELGRGASHPSVADAYCEYVNILSWIRSLDERLEHEYHKRKVGLLPALAAGRLQDRARVLTDGLRRGLAIEARHLANYALHHSTIPYAFNSSARIVDGRLELPIPNRVESPVSSHLDLRYSDGRTLSSFATEATMIVVTFMDQLIDAFEDELPARVRRK